MVDKIQRILVAVSGGVDSAVACHLLKKQGHEVEAVYVRTWEQEDDPFGNCPGAEDLKDARSTARHLDVPFHVVNFIDFYQKEVVTPMVNGYAQGITPNPDILCNRRMKFGALMEYAKDNNFNALATGHYCQKKIAKNGCSELWEGADKNKDQSYFLAQISQKQLDFARFPIGAIAKTKVREIAKQIGLSVAEKKDSQGICFLGKVKIPEFLSNFIDDQPGEIVKTDGTVLGYHQGLHRFTLGQRKGIGIPSNSDHDKYVVTGKDIEKNQLIVAFENKKEPTLWGQKYQIESVSFFDNEEPTTAMSFLGKARYRDAPTQLTYQPGKGQTAEINFETPQRALTPGQVLALYKGEKLIGSGVYSLSKLGRSELSA